MLSTLKPAKSYGSTIPAPAYLHRPLYSQLMVKNLLRSPREVDQEDVEEAISS